MNTTNKAFKIVSYEVAGIGTIYHIHRAEIAFGSVGEFKRVSPDGFFSEAAAERDLSRHEAYYLNAVEMN